ncbi:MAG TPA: ComF family protein [Terracidiphilus sp.]|nr:ComF family protein [Terracidiphilus sp.]
MRDAIHALKYDGLLAAARPLGAMLAIAISQLAGVAPAEMMVIPVPLHRSKYAERGFNQARMLATHALEALRRSHPAWRLKLAPGTVLRVRATASQASQSPRQRRINVRGAFRVADPAQVRSRDILVIDDIFTTGATVRSVAQELRQAGAASVWVATLARARLYFGNRLDAARDRSGSMVETEEFSELPRNPSADSTVSESMHSSSSRQQSF